MACVTVVHVRFRYSLCIKSNCEYRSERRFYSLPRTNVHFLLWALSRLTTSMQQQPLMMAPARLPMPGYQQQLPAAQVANQPLLAAPPPAQYQQPLLGQAPPPQQQPPQQYSAQPTVVPAMVQVCIILKYRIVGIFGDLIIEVSVAIFILNNKHWYVINSMRLSVLWNTQVQARGRVVCM